MLSGGHWVAAGKGGSIPPFPTSPSATSVFDAILPFVFDAGLTDPGATREQQAQGVPATCHQPPGGRGILEVALEATTVHLRQEGLSLY